MPEIGEKKEVFALKVDLRAQGGARPENRKETFTYIPPDGWVIMNVRYVDNTKFGNSEAPISYEPASVNIITTNTFDGRIKANGEYRYAQVWAKGDLDAKVNTIQQKIQSYQNLARRLVVRARAKGEQFGRGARIDRDFYATIEYAGTLNESERIFNKEFAMILPSRVLNPDDWRTDAKNSRKQYLSNQSFNFDLFVNNSGGNDSSRIWAGYESLEPGLYTFKPSLRKTGGNPDVSIILQEDKDGVIKGSNENRITLTNELQAFSVSYTKQERDTNLYGIIRLKDSSSNDIVLNAYYTFIVKENSRNFSSMYKELDS